MGKGFTSVLALCAAGLFSALIVLAPHLNVAQAAALALGIVTVSAGAWCAALATAIGRLVRSGRGLRAVVALLLFFWLPILPPLVYGLSGLFSRQPQPPRAPRGASRAKQTPLPVGAAQAKSLAGRKRFTLPPVDDLVLSSVRPSSRRQP